MVERERLLALSIQYGWDEKSGTASGMVPLEQWCPDDRAETNSLLDLADSRNEARKSWGTFGGR